MTEKSYFWDGIVTGDATLAPYNAGEFNTWMFSAFLSNNITDGYVVPGYLSDLNIRSAGNTAHSVVIESGAVCANNVLYVLDSAKTFPILRASSDRFRRDSIMLRINYNTRQARLAVIVGAENVWPGDALAPTPTRTASVYEIVLADVLVDSTLTYVSDAFVYDKRRFIYNIFEKSQFEGGSSNLLRNSEWLAYSRVSAAVNPPDEWVQITGPGSIVARGAVLEGSGRGNWGVNFAVGKYGQWVVVSGHTFTMKVFIDNVDTSYTRNVLIGIQGYRVGGELSSVSKEQRLYDISVTEIDREFTFTVTFPENDIEKVFVYIDYYEFSTLFNPLTLVSQILLLPGYHVGGYRPIAEMIMFKNAIADAAWAATAKSTGTTTINFTTDFSALIKNYTRAVILRLRGRDSGSGAAASCYLRARGYAAPYDSVYGHLEISGITNDVWREQAVIVPIDQIYFGTGTAGAQLRLDVVATGAGTFDATVEVVGIII